MTMDARHQITELVAGLHDSGPEGWDRVLPIVYDELRRIAHRELRRQSGGGHTLNTTALVHEAYFKLVDQTAMSYGERAHFFGVASRAMRQVLIDHARRYATAKRGGGWQRLSLEAADVSVEERADILLALDEALTRLAVLNERLARVVECRFFGGLSEAETASVLGVTDRTVRRDWTKARLWLFSELEEAGA
jgi:RNA polymerase sigma factor (TIGR02999 family)